MRLASALKRTGGTISALLIAGLFLAALPHPAHAATSLQRGFDDMPAQDIVFDNLDISKAAFTSSTQAISMKTTKSYNGRKAVVWNVTATGPKSLANPFEIKFANAGFDSSGDRVDLILSCVSCKAQVHAGANPAAREQVLMINELPANDSRWNEYVLLTSLPDGGASALYGIQLTFDVRVCKTGTTQTCDPPLLMVVKDLDWYDETISSKSWSGTYAESITLNSGYGASSHIAGNSILGHNSANTRFYGSAVDESTEKSTVAFTLEGAGGRITWAGSDCSTRLFEAKTFTINASAGPGGSISPQGDATVGWRTDRVYSIEASPGFKIDRVLIDGKKTGQSEGKRFEYAFEDVRDNHSIRVEFAPIEYSVVFDGNGATSGSTDPLESCRFNQAITLPESGFDRTMHRFVCWNTQPDGSGDSFLPGDSIEGLACEDGGVVTLYAQWEDLSCVYTISVLIPKDDYARAVALGEGPLRVAVSLADEGQGLDWSYVIDLSNPETSHEYAATTVSVPASENARCSLLDSSLFTLVRQMDHTRFTAFVLDLPDYIPQGSSDCIVNHFPAGDEAGSDKANASPTNADGSRKEVEHADGGAADKEEGKDEENAEAKGAESDDTARESATDDGATIQQQENNPDAEAKSPGEQNASKPLMACGPEINRIIPAEAKHVSFGRPQSGIDSADDLSADGDERVLGVFDEEALSYSIFSADGSPVVASEDCSKMFEGRSALVSVDAQGLDVSRTKDFSRMFEGCGSLESVDLSTWDTSSAESMEDMFSDCPALLSLTLGESWTQPEEARLQSRFPVMMASDHEAYASGSTIPCRQGAYSAIREQETLEACGEDEPLGPNAIPSERMHPFTLAGNDAPPGSPNPEASPNSSTSPGSGWDPNVSLESGAALESSPNQGLASGKDAS